MNVARFCLFAPLLFAACAPIAPDSLVGCGNGKVCPAGRTCVSAVCVPATDGGTGGGGGAGCMADADCATGHCLDGACVVCAAEADCLVGTCSPNHSCVPLPDGCSTAEPLDLSTGPIHVTGSLLKAADDTRLSCATSTQGSDLVYQLMVPTEGRLVATVQTNGSFRPALELRTECSNVSDPLQCSRASANQASTATLQLDPIAAGTYYLWLDSDDGAAGDFTLDVALETTQPSDGCANVTPYEIGDKQVVFSGSTQGLKDDTHGSCGGQGAPDAVFAVHANAPVQLRIDLSSSSPGYSPLLYLRQRCGDESASEQVACLDGANPSFTLPSFGPGDLFLFVDGAQNALDDAGDFTLRVTPMPVAAPPTNDKCGFAQQLAVPATGSGSVSVQSDTSAATDDSDGCGGSGSPDLVYSFHLDEPRLVQATVTPLFGANYLPVVYFRPANACSSEAMSDQLACTTAYDFGQSATALVPSLPAGDWFLWVDGLLSSGPFNLQVTTADPPPAPSNDNCSMPTALNVSSGYGTQTGTTLGAAEDLVDGRCAAASPDVVFGISLAQTSYIGLDLKASSGSTLLPVVELRGGGQGFACTASMQSSALLGCNGSDATVANRTVYTEPNVPPGDYWVWVEGSEGSQGDFSLRVVTQTTPPMPANDNCQSVSLPLTMGTPVSSDTRNAMADAMDYWLDGDPTEFGRDVVYTVVVTSASNLTVKVTPSMSNDGALLRPIVALRTACNDPSSTLEAAAADDYGPTVFTHTFSQVPAGTYWLWVGGVRASSGAFTLTLQ